MSRITIDGQAIILTHAELCEIDALAEKKKKTREEAAVEHLGLEKPKPKKKAAKRRSKKRRVS